VSRLPQTILRSWERGYQIIITSWLQLTVNKWMLLHSAWISIFVSSYCLASFSTRSSMGDYRCANRRIGTLYSTPTL